MGSNYVMARINLIVVATILCLQLVNCQDLTKAFSHGDENQDGKLSKKELRSAMETMGIFMNKADSVHASSTHDVNSDNRIDMAEFQVLAAAEQSAGLGRLCRRSLEASGALGLVEDSAHYVDLALPAAMAVSAPGDLRCWHLSRIQIRVVRQASRLRFGCSGALSGAAGHLCRPGFTK